MTQLKYTVCTKFASIRIKLEYLELKKMYQWQLDNFLTFQQPKFRVIKDLRLALLVLNRSI